MEIRVGDYGRMMFEMITGKYKDMPDHWASIREKAEPLVRQLIDLNDEMKGEGSYTIVGYKDKKGKKKLSTGERIRKTQKKLWGTKVRFLKEGDLIWQSCGDEIDTYVGQDDPCPVEYVKSDYAAVEVLHQGGEHIAKLYHYENDVLKAPDDWQELKEIYSSDQYWLEQADKLGI